MIVKFKVRIPKLTGEKTRRAYVYLPDSYKREQEKHYPVLYMFDGHNVFYDKDATYGKSWGMGEYLKKSKKQVIVAAVECNHEGMDRLKEYSPYSFSFPETGKITGKGHAYMQWLVDEFKPYIDSHYRTLPDRENTFIAGSSMGGLMSLYALTAFNHVFSRAACLSPSLWVDYNRMIQTIGKSRLGPNTIAYVDYGSQELENHDQMLLVLMGTLQMCLSRGIHMNFRIVPDGTHSEESWERQIPIFMECLGI